MKEDIMPEKKLGEKISPLPKEDWMKKKCNEWHDKEK